MNWIAKYRIFRPIKIDDGLKIVRGYRPYYCREDKKCGFEDFDSWNEIVGLWSPEIRIFAQLPVSEEDKHFGYGTSDYWFPYRFRNVTEKESWKNICRVD